MQVIGATSPLGCRLTASLALHGARLSLLGDKSEKLEMEQVGLEQGTCQLWAVGAESQQQ